MHKIPRFRWSCACANYHPGFCPPFIHSILSNDCVSGQWRPWSDCASAQSDLGLRRLHKTQRHIFAWWGSDNNVAMATVGEQQWPWPELTWIFAWNIKSYFPGKIRKIFQYVVCWNLPSMLSVDVICFTERWLKEEKTKRLVITL